jgi:hypothetical protein
VNAVWRTIRSYILWQHERGTLHYDIMVTLILVFVFFSPYWINYNDKPASRNPHPTDVVVTPQASGLFLYQISGTAVTANDDRSIRQQLLSVIEPISGEVSIVSYQPVKDRKGHILAYKVVVQK